GINGVSNPPTHCTHAELWERTNAMGNDTLSSKLSDMVIGDVAADSNPKRNPWKHVIDDSEGQEVRESSSGCRNRERASQQNKISSQFRPESIADRVVATNGATPKSLDTEPAPATFGPSETATARTVEKGAGEKCFEKMKSTWSEAYDQLSATIQAEMAK
ncbi:hypothetical protein Tco_0918719, partial [Tanacetum coccineum]